MNKELLKTQLDEIDGILREVHEREDKDLENKLQIVRSFVLSLLRPEEFSDIQREDFRRLAQELGYDANTNFADWWQQALVV